MSDMYDSFDVAAYNILGDSEPSLPSIEVALHVV